MKIKPGFLLFENGTSITWIAQHSGPALETPTSRDSNSDTVASLAWMKVGGKLVVSTMPRKRALGIDFNRDKPPLKKSLEYYPYFVNDEEPAKLHEYREKYAFTARNRQDYQRRLSVYNNFWKEVKEAKNTSVFIHTKFTRLKNFPSIMDVIAYEDYGFSKKILAPIIRKINRKNSDFFSYISENYKNAILLNQKRVIERIVEVYGSFALDDIGIEYKVHLNSDLKIIEKYANGDIFLRLRKKFSEKNFLNAAKSALNNAGNPRITIESIFKGSHGRGQMKNMFRNRNVISIESNAFLNYWYPDEASDIVLDIINEIKPMRKITNYLQEMEVCD